MIKKTKPKKGINIKKVIFVLFIFYFVYTICDQQIKINKYNSQITMYNKDIESKKELTQYYEEKKADVSSDEYIEQVAREKLGLVKPYEKIFVDVNNQ